MDFFQSHIQMFARRTSLVILRDVQFGYVLVSSVESNSRISYRLRMGRNPNSSLLHVKEEERSYIHGFSPNS